MIDDATDYTIVALVESHSSQALWDCYERHWLNWAGPPDEWASDNERGLIGDRFVQALARSRTIFNPAVGYAPWQKGKVERRNRFAKEIMRKTMKLT